MNRIVRENYPVAELPEDLRAEFPLDATVRLIIEPPEPPPERVLSLDELWAMARPTYQTSEEVVEAVRRMRDEWDD